MRIDIFQQTRVRDESSTEVGPRHVAAAQQAARTSTDTGHVPVQHGSTTAEPVRGTTVWVDSGAKAVYQVLDQKTGDVICQLPSQEVLRVSKNIADLLDTAETRKIDLES